MMKKEPFDPTQQDEKKVPKYSNMTYDELIQLDRKLGLFGSKESVDEFVKKLQPEEIERFKNSLAKK